MWLLTTGIAVKSPVAVGRFGANRPLWNIGGPESVIQWRNRFRFRLWIRGIDFYSDPGVK